MSCSLVIPLDTNEEFNDCWGQYVIIDMEEEPVSNLDYLTTSLVDLEEGKLKEEKDSYYELSYCTIC